MSATSPDDPSSKDSASQPATAPPEPGAAEKAEEPRPEATAEPTADADAEPTPETPETVAALIKGSIDEALARWDAAFGITPEDEAAAAEDLEGFDARRHLAAASTRAVNRYLSEHGLANEAGQALLKPTPAFLAEHGVPLMSVVFAALEQAITSALTEQVEGRKPTELDPAGRLQIDLSDLFGPEEP